ncbi:MAG: TadE/TadG family type IV pilus assembly protein [Chloroflexota bacterium]
MLALPILLLFLLGIIELGRMFLIFVEATSASREASRYGASVGSDGVGGVRYPRPPKALRRLRPLHLRGPRPPPATHPSPCPPIPLGQPTRLSPRRRPSRRRTTSRRRRTAPTASSDSLGTPSPAHTTTPSTNHVASARPHGLPD